jgi:hypothetical protein
MKAAKSYLLVLGTTGLLTATVVVLLVVGSGVAAFNGPPDSDGTSSPLERIVVDEDGHWADRTAPGPPADAAHSGSGQGVARGAPERLGGAPVGAPGGPSGGGAPGAGPSGDPAGGDSSDGPAGGDSSDGPAGGDSSDGPAGGGSSGGGGLPLPPPVRDTVGDALPPPVRDTVEGATGSVRRRGGGSGD